MVDRDSLLERIAAALEQIVPMPGRDPDWLSCPAFIWTGRDVRGIEQIEAPALDNLRGIDRQKALVTENIARLAAGHAAHDMLLWGARGMGKSALTRAAVVEAQKSDPSAIALVQVAPDALPTLSELFGLLGAAQRNFLVYLDDLGFDDGDDYGARRLRSWLDGGVEARPPNARLVVTSNRRAIVARHASEQDDPINPRDAVDDKLALADRFGLSLGFHNCTQDEYLDIVHGYAKTHGLDWQEADALEWAKRRGARSGRTAWQFITELAGRQGKPL